MNRHDGSARRMATMLPHIALFGALGCACVGSIGDNDAVPGRPPAATTPPANATSDPAIEQACSTSYSPGHVSIHRLTNDEYNNTVRDLLFTASRPGDRFDPSPRGRSGFSNDSDGLAISDVLVASYYAAAEALAKEVLASKGKTGGAYEKLVTCAPSAACAEASITSLARRAYRRPASAGEIKALMGVFGADADFDTGIQDAIIAILMNPKFLFVHVTDPKSRTEGAPFVIDAHGLAARLSYALWQTMPDAELSQLADSGQLNDRSALAAQVTRMLKDPRIGGLLATLRNDWAGLATLADPAGKLQGLDDGVRASMVTEVDAFLGDLVKNDKSFLNVVSGDYAFADKTMATYYGVPFPGTDPTSFVPVKLPANRKGLVTSAAILTATAGDVTYTHLVHRGKWMTHQVLCTPPPPPPGKTPPIDPNAGGGTPREKLLAHVKNPACSGCHVVMDAVGIGLENYDPFGKWREVYPGSVAIDASGTLPDGKSFTTPIEMLDDLAGDDQTKTCLAQQMLSYAVTRAMTSTDDLCVSKAIGVASVTPTGRFSDLVLKIVRSRQFFMQTGEAP